jgi:hypothetical protein
MIPKGKDFLMGGKVGGERALDSCLVPIQN